MRTSRSAKLVHICIIAVILLSLLSFYVSTNAQATYSPQNTPSFATTPTLPICGLQFTVFFNGTAGHIGQFVVETASPSSLFTSPLSKFNSTGIFNSTVDPSFWNIAGVNGSALFIKLSDLTAVPTTSSLQSFPYAACRYVTLTTTIVQTQTTVSNRTIVHNQTKTITTTNTTTNTISNTITTTTTTTLTSSTSTPGAYSVSFSPNYNWQCNQQEGVTLTGPITEQGHAGHQLQFIYEQFSNSNPNYLVPIFSHTLTASTDDTVTDTIYPSDWGSTNFYTMPFLYVIVQDITVPSGNQPIQLPLASEPNIQLPTCGLTTTASSVSTSFTTTTTSTSVSITSFVSTIPGGIVTLPSLTVHAGQVTVPNTVSSTNTTWVPETDTTTTYSPTVTATLTMPVTISPTIDGWVPPLNILYGLYTVIALSAGAAGIVVAGFYARRKFSTRVGGMFRPKLSGWPKIWQGRHAKQKAGKRGPGRPKKEEEPKQEKPNSENDAKKSANDHSLESTADTLSKIGDET